MVCWPPWVGEDPGGSGKLGDAVGAHAARERQRLALLFGAESGGEASWRQICLARPLRRPQRRPREGLISRPSTSRRSSQPPADCRRRARRSDQGTPTRRWRACISTERLASSAGRKDRRTRSAVSPSRTRQARPHNPGRRAQPTGDGSRPPSVPAVLVALRICLATSLDWLANPMCTQRHITPG